MKVKLIIVLIIIFTTIQSCCRTPTYTPQIKTELYFGLSNSKDPILDTAWIKFKEQKIEAILNGYTEINGNGFWKDSDGKSIYERSVIIVYVHEQSNLEDRKIDSLISLYKKEFHQESVLKTEHEIKTYF